MLTKIRNLLQRIDGALAVLRGIEVAAQVGRQAGVALGTKVLENYWTVECRDRYGNLKWVEQFPNLVTTAGLNDSLTQHLKGSGYTAAWYVGVTTGTNTFNAADTMSSHAGWTECQDYSESTRPTCTFGSVSGGSVDNSASKARFTCNGSSKVFGGAFLTTNNTKGGTTGTLYGGAAFSSNKTLDSGDTLDVTITCTAS